jgi:hypothetical protein
MRPLYLLVFLSFSAGWALGQNSTGFPEKYYYFIDRANHSYMDKAFQASALCYDSAFQSAGGKGKPGDLYQAACCWALAGDPDKAFFYLDKTAREGKWSSLDHTLKDDDLVSLHADKRWQEEMDRIRLNRLEKEGKIDKPLEDTLNKVYGDDQGDRLKIDSIEKRFGFQSHQMDSLWQLINDKDSVNLGIVTGILERKGWPGPDEVGERASMAVFLVIQHADSLTQVTYLPAMRTAVQQGKARAEDLALLEDRVLVKQGKGQLYGSQVQQGINGKASFFPIQDEPNVDKRRASVGLGPLEEYARYFGIDYHLPSPGGQSNPSPPPSH